MARSTLWKELRFFISVRTPKGSPGLCTLRFTSQRMLPSFMRQSLTPV